PVAGLEDLEGQHDPGEQRRREREQRDDFARDPSRVVGHSESLRRTIPAGGVPADARWIPWIRLARRTRRWPVLARIDLRTTALPGQRELAALLPRAATDIDSVLATVRPL